MQLIDAQTLISKVALCLEMGDPSNPCVSRAIQFLSQTVGDGVTTISNNWGFNIDSLDPNNIRSENTLEEIRNLEEKMKIDVSKNNKLIKYKVLYNTRIFYGNR